MDDETREDLLAELEAELLVGGFPGAARMIIREAQCRPRGIVYDLVGAVMYHDVGDLPSSILLTRSYLTDAITMEARRIGNHTGYYLSQIEVSAILDLNTPPAVLRNASELLSEVRKALGELRENVIRNS